MSWDLTDCTNQCGSIKHGDIISASITKRCVTDYDLCCYLNFICCNCENVQDSDGRTALHVAASCGRTNLVHWLIHNRHANINARDKESGYTALHRSIFYGKINVAVELMKQGVNLDIYDFNNLTPLEHAMKDGPKPSLNYGELYVWGSNINNTFGPKQSRTYPELLDDFHKEYPLETVQQVCMDKFHTIIVTASGKVYSSGHGQGGRLGLGIQHSVITPLLVHFPEQLDKLQCIQASVSSDHSLFLMSDNNVYSCGINTHKVLGIEPSPEQALKPTLIKHLNGVTGVCSGNYHSIAWGPKCLYTWGLNAGQLGHKLEGPDKYVIKPKKIKVVNFDESSIIALNASNGATTFCTSKGDIYVLHEYLCRKIASRQLNVVQLSIVGGKLNTALYKEELKVVALTNTGNLLLWQESDPQLCRCIFSINRAIIIKQAIININGISFVTNDGEAFLSIIKPRKHKATSSQSKNDKNSQFHKFLDREDCVSLKINKVPRIHRAISIQSDIKGHNYCVIQQAPYKNFQFPDMESSEIQEHFKTLLNEAHENDEIHDVVFKLDDNYFPAHRFICATRSSHLEKILLADSKRIIEITDCKPEIFKQFLLYMYNGTCDLVKPGLCPMNLLKLSNKTDKKPKKSVNNLENEEQGSVVEEDVKERSSVRLLQDLAKKMGCVDLQKVLSNIVVQKDLIKIKNEAVNHKLEELKFARETLQEYYDVTIKCSDGKFLKAHKCVLAARMEYFNNMFSMRWHGGNTSTVTMPFPKSVVEALLEYLYTDTLSSLANKEIDHLFKVLVLADQLFVSRLKEQCEFLLSSLLTLKNSIQLLSFSHIYNAKKLKYCCLKFIIYNISSILEMGILEDLDEDLLKELSDFYFENKPEVWCRVITPYSTAPSDEIIQSVSSTYPISLDEEKEEKHIQKSSHTKRRSRTNAHKHSSIPQESINLINKEEKENYDSIKMPIKETESPINNRLKAIKLAEEIVNDESVEPQYTKLNHNETILSASFEDFPLLNSTLASCAKSPDKNESISGFNHKHKIVRLSQKQRKRLSSETVVEPIQESPKNPWKIINHPNGNAQSPPFNTNIQDIISCERKQKENLVKMTSKLLIYTQIEDKAIDDLHKFYNTENNFDEYITIERVDIGAVASPVWVPKKKLDS